jgi:hypothetical protein
MRENLTSIFMNFSDGSYMDLSHEVLSTLKNSPYSSEVIVPNMESIEGLIRAIEEISSDRLLFVISGKTFHYDGVLFFHLPITISGEKKISHEKLLLMILQKSCHQSAILINSDMENKIQMFSKNIKEGEIIKGIAGGISSENGKAFQLLVPVTNRSICELFLPFLQEENTLMPKSIFSFYYNQYKYLDGYNHFMLLDLIGSEGGSLILN